MTISILNEIHAERERQEANVLTNSGWRSLADPSTSTTYRLGVLGEECGEVNKEVLELLVGEQHDIGRVRTELVQVGAVCVAWIIGIDRGWRP